MDPQVCLFEILQSFSDAQSGEEIDREFLAYQLRYLSAWIEKKGFLPKVVRLHGADDLLGAYRSFGV